MQCKCPRKNEKGENCCNGNLLRNDSRAYWEVTAVSEFGLVGYKMPSWISPKTSIANDVYRKYMESIGNPKKEYAFHKTVKAEPYDASGHKIPQSTLQRCVKKDYIFDVKSEPDCAYSVFSHPGPSYMGIDINSENFDISVSSADSENPKNQKLLYIGKLNSNEGVGRLNELVDRYNIECCVVDKQEAIMSKQIQAELNCPVWRCHFPSTPTSEERFNHEAGIYNIVRTELCDLAYAELRSRGIVLPENYAEVFEGAYMNEMMAMHKVFKENEKTGKFIGSWISNQANDSFLSNAYRHCAYRMCCDSVLRGSDCVYTG